MLALNLLGLGFAEIGKRIAAVARGTQLPVSPLPTGITFPDRYKISAACSKALKRALEREPRMRVGEFAQIWMKRTEERYFSLQPGIRRGETKAIATGGDILKLQASFIGRDSIQLPVAATDEPEEQRISSGVVGVFKGALDVLVEYGIVEIPGYRTIPIEPETKEIETTAEPCESIREEPELSAKKKEQDEGSK